MEGLRLLIVDESAKRAEERSALLDALRHSAYSVANLEEAVEALAIERFSALLVSSAVARPEEIEDCLCAAGVNVTGLLGVVSLSPDADGPELKAVLSTLQERARALQGGGRTLFKAEDFEEQCAGEVELMVEILDLFFTEKQHQIPDMRKALQEGDFRHLSHIAHTLKGSFGSLQAPVAWERAQVLEAAALRRDTVGCERCLEALESDIVQLEAQLLAFRGACLRR